MSDEHLQLEPDLAFYFETHISELCAALDTVLDYKSEYRAIVLSSIREGRSCWEELISAILSISLPFNQNAGDVLSGALHGLLDEGLIVKRGFGEYEIGENRCLEI
jgi:hypothetical protein